MNNDILYRSIIHEIKNDICIVNGYLQLIEKAHPEVLAFRHWDTVTDDIRDLICLILNFSQAQKPVTLKRQTIRVGSYFDRLREEFDAINPNDVRLRMEIEPKLSSMNADPTLLKQALLNLVKNGIEAIDPSDEEGELAVQVSGDVGQINIEIRDNGCGIEQTRKEDIFLPDFSSKHNGTGLGLYITKRIIDAHEGTIACESVPDEGTSFQITLPANGIVAGS